MEYLFEYLGRQIVVQVNEDVDNKYVASAFIQDLDGEIRHENVIMLDDRFNDAETAISATLKRAQDIINADS